MKKIIKFAGVALTSAAIVAMPVFSASAESANTVITANVGSTISITATPTVAINVTPSASAAATGTGASTVSVSTNAAGYRLSIKDADTDTNLKSGANNIAAHTGTFGAMTQLADNTWGYNINAGTSYAGVTTSDVQIKETSAAAQTDNTTVTFGVKVDATKPAGAYTDTVTFTAVAK